MNKSLLVATLIAVAVAACGKKEAPPTAGNEVIITIGHAAPLTGPQAHLGVMVAGFPNLWLMLGPNTATGHTSTLLFIEPGVRWAVRAMLELRRRGLCWIEVKDEVMRASNAALQARLKRSVWAGCRSWYRAPDGKIFALFPGFTREYVRAVGSQRISDFETR